MTSHFILRAVLLDLNSTEMKSLKKTITFILKKKKLILQVKFNVPSMSYFQYGVIWIVKIAIYKVTVVVRSAL